MKLTIEIDDKDLQRVVPCQQNGKHDHADCVIKYLVEGMIGGAYKRESEVMQKEFAETYDRPSVKVTAE